MEEVKTCTICSRALPIHLFRLSGKKHRSECRECERTRARDYMTRRRLESPDLVKLNKRTSYLRNREKYIERAKQIYQATRETRLEKASLYRDRNRERIRQWHRQYYRENREKRLAKDRKYRQQNPDKCRVRYRVYKDKNRVLIRALNRLRKARLSHQKVQYTQSDWERALYFFNGCCAVCGRQPGLWHTLAQDHWIPLKHGGLTAPNNIVPLCHGVNGCNNRKHDKFPKEWLNEMYGKKKALAILKRVESFFASLIT